MEINMTPKMNEIKLPDDVEMGNDHVESYLPILPLEPEFPETPANRPAAISAYPVNKVKKEAKASDRNHIALYEVKKVPRVHIAGRERMGISEIPITKVAPKAPEKKYETVFTFNSKVKKAPKHEEARESAIEGFDIYTRKVAKKEKATPQHISSYEDRDDKVGELYFEKAEKRRIDTVGKK